MEYKLSNQVSARLKPNVVPHLFTCQSDRSSSKKTARVSSENRSRKKLIVDLMKESEEKMEREICEASIPEEASQLMQNIPSASCTTLSRGTQVHLQMEDALTSPIKTIVSDLKKPAVNTVLQMMKEPVDLKLRSQPVDTSDSSDIYQPTESTSTDVSPLKPPNNQQKIAEVFLNIIEKKVTFVYWNSDHLLGIY
ncbi:hypothetical protein NQ315_014466 [Exocentrus adspersus]|uniref:Uncharacterized protein n=1 Tax=Exocentrus adspersus TaxID=1586481 RepID=A0AAV8VEM2_9CUCU|nr:hypothetical protein NQ315_014466 [Exocentrus adspersus]